MSFIGLVNYFGDHIPHLAEELKLLREVEAEARKSKQLRWTDDRRYQFEHIKSIVIKLQPLYFLKDGVKSRFIQTPQIMPSADMYTRNSTTTETECYAIYMALHKLNISFRMLRLSYSLIILYILILHRLTKVLRWKLDLIQEYNIFINDIKSELNLVAGGYLD